MRVEPHLKVGEYMVGSSAQGHYRGCRSTRDGGEWNFYRDADGRAICTGEIYECTDLNPSVSNTMLKEELRMGMQAAMLGELRFGEDQDVTDIHREPDMLELRLGHRAFDGDEGVAYKFRLYFSEPASVQRLLLGLKFGKAPATKAGLEVQDEHIDEAADRYMKWTQAQLG